MLNLLLVDGPYCGLTLEQVPDEYLETLLAEDGRAPELRAAARLVLERRAYRPAAVRVTTHAINRWSERVLGIGQVGQELQQQAQRAWYEGREIAARKGKQRRVWREMVWVFAVEGPIATLVTVHGPDESDALSEGAEVPDARFSGQD